MHVCARVCMCVYMCVCVCVCVHGVCVDEREIITIVHYHVHNPRTSRVVFTPNPALVANLCQCFEEKVKVNFSIFVWLMSVWYLSHLNVAWETEIMDGREGRKRDPEKGGRKGMKKASC